jgi:DNA-binding CsgD family transcriptional regulator
MRPNPDIPCAQSKPADAQDEVISALLYRAGELLDGQLGALGSRPYDRTQTVRAVSKHAPTPLQTALDNLLAIVQQDAELSRLLAILPQALGNGLILQSVFARLFDTQPQPLAHVLPAYSEKKPTLTQREREVLTEVARGRLINEIPAHIPPTRDGTPVAADTVKRHLTHIYRKLDVVRSPKEAVAKAAALGLLKLDLTDLIQSLRDCKALSFNAFTGILLEGIDQGQKHSEIAGPTKQMAALSLLMFLSICLMGQVRFDQDY